MDLSLEGVYHSLPSDTIDRTALPDDSAYTRILSVAHRYLRRILRWAYQKGKCVRSSVVRGSLRLELSAVETRLKSFDDADNSAAGGKQSMIDS
jgi:hypothetical protein